MEIVYDYYKLTTTENEGIIQRVSFFWKSFQVDSLGYTECLSFKVTSYSINKMTEHQNGCDFQNLLESVSKSCNIRRLRLINLTILFSLVMIGFIFDMVAFSRVKSDFKAIFIDDTKSNYSYKKSYNQTDEDIESIQAMTRPKYDINCRLLFEDNPEEQSKAAGLLRNLRAGRKGTASLLFLEKTT